MSTVALSGSNSSESIGTRLRVAVIGVGFIGDVHARAARAAGARLQLVGASTIERSRAAAERLGAPRWVSSPEELADADDVDVVHVCTPNATHIEYVEAALSSGKHVICEKPLGVDMESAARVTELAMAKGLVGVVPFVYRFYPAVRYARDKVSTGSVGPLHLLHGQYLQDWLSRTDDWSWRVDLATNGPSRAFADIGSHWCDLVEFVSGHRITRIFARLDTVVKERRVAENATSFSLGDGDGQMRRVETEDTALVLFETNHGARGSTIVSQISPGRKNRLWFEIDGRDESLVFDQEHPEALWIGTRDKETSVPRGSTLMGPQAMRLSTLPPGHPQGYRECFDQFTADAYDAIRGEVPDGLPTFADGLRSTQIIEAVLESARSERWVDVAMMPAPAQPV